MATKKIQKRRQTNRNEQKFTTTKKLLKKLTGTGMDSCGLKWTETDTNGQNRTKTN